MDCGIYITIRVPPQTARLRRDGVVSVSTGRLSSSRIAAIGHFIIHSIFQRLHHGIATFSLVPQDRSQSQGFDR
jgi:hypothetical protein